LASQERLKSCLSDLVPYCDAADVVCTLILKKVLLWVRLERGLLGGVNLGTVIRQIVDSNFGMHSIYYWGCMVVCWLALGSWFGTFFVEFACSTCTCVDSLSLASSHCSKTCMLG